MTTSVAKVYEAALALTVEEREELAAMLEESLEENRLSVEEAWAEEIDRRVAEVDAGKEVLIPLAEVQQQVAEIIRQAKLTHG